jgi:hypothetical protein
MPPRMAWGRFMLIVMRKKLPITGGLTSVGGTVRMTNMQFVPGLMCLLMEVNVICLRGL